MSLGMRLMLMGSGGRMAEPIAKDIYAQLEKNAASAVRKSGAGMLYLRASVEPNRQQAAWLIEQAGARL
jgi:hypothetical protein